MYQPSNVRHIQQRLERFLGSSNMPSSYSGDIQLENFAKQERSVLGSGRYLAIAFLRNSNTKRANLRDYLAGLYIVVAISGLSIICAIMRLATLIVVVHVKPEDVSWNFHSSIIPFVSVLEVYIALITSSVPAIYPLACRSRFFCCWRRKRCNKQLLSSEEAWGSNVDTLTNSSELAAINDSHSINHSKWFRLKSGRSKSESTFAPTILEDIAMTDARQVIKIRPSFAPSIPNLPEILPV